MSSLAAGNTWKYTVWNVSDG